MQITQKINPCLWFDQQAEEAAAFYISVFKDSRILATTRYGKAGYEFHHQPEGSVMSVVFELQGQRFTALNGGPLFTFNEAISLQVNCTDQVEIDYFWTALGQGGDPKAQQCGWLKDRYGVSWQVLPNWLNEVAGRGDAQASERLMSAMMPMVKLDLAKMKAAFEGKH